MRTSATGRRTERGFTLIELLVVLVVIGLLSAAGTVVLGGRQERQMNRHALTVAEFLKSARRNAQVSGKIRQVNVSSADLSVADTGIALKQQTKMAFRLLEGGQRIRRSDAVLFYPDGSSTGGLVELSWKGEVRRIDIDWWGRVHVGN